MKKDEGLIYVFEGNGKGKTSAALGVACRMLCNDKKVVWISWLKDNSWKVSESKMEKVFGKNMKMYWMGKGFYGGPEDHYSPEEHREAARVGLELAKKVLRKEKDKVDLLIMDEVIKAINEGLLKIEEVLEVLKMRKKTHIVLTGHDCPRGLSRMADLVTEMKKVKHPYDKGVLAVKGLDF